METEANQSISQEKLKNILDYDPYTGIFIWKVDIPHTKTGFKGSVAGTTCKKGYITITIDKARFLAHRLAWFYVYGYFPEYGIDHKDRVKNNNRISNLREVAQLCNTRNVGNSKRNNSGVKGVNWYKKTRKWRSSIQVMGKQEDQQFHESFDSAVEARWESEKKYNFPNCCTTSPAYEYLKTNGLI